jgi:hypothetical protein
LAYNQKSFKKGDKPNNAGVPRERVSVNFRKLLRDTTNWKKAAKIMQKMAFGGYDYVNGNGITITALPDKEWFRMLCEYTEGLGKPIMITDTDAVTKDALTKFTEFVSGVSGTKAVNTNGDVVEHNVNADTPAESVKVSTTEEAHVDTDTASTDIPASN